MAFSTFKQFTNFSTLDQVPNFIERHKLITNFKQTNEDFEKRFIEEIFKAICEDNEREKHKWNFEKKVEDSKNPTTISINTKFLQEDYACGGQVFKGHELLYGIQHTESWIVRDLEMWEKCNVARVFKKLQKYYLDLRFFLQDISVADEMNIIISNHAYIKEPLWHSLNILPEDCKLTNDERLEYIETETNFIFNNDLFLKIACEEYKKDLIEQILRSIPEVLQFDRQVNLDTTFLQKCYHGRNYDFFAKNIHENIFEIIHENIFGKILGPFEEVQKYLEKKGYLLTDNRDKRTFHNVPTFRYEIYICGDKRKVDLYATNVNFFELACKM